MSTLEDVQNAIVDVVDTALYPNGDDELSIALNRMSSIAMDEKGTGYSPLDTIVTIGGDGTGALAVPSILGDTVDSINLVPAAYGFNYSEEPAVTITGSGTDAQATATITPINIYIAAGDFLKLNLDQSLKNGDVFVVVFATKAMSRNTTRLRRDYAYQEIPDATLTMTVAGDTITIGGTVTAGEACMTIVQGTGYAVKAVSNSTPTTLATALAALIPNATSLGAVITVPNVYDMVARVSVQGTAKRILHSEQGIFRVRVIAPTEALRDYIGENIQLAIATHTNAQGVEYYLDMPDGVAASIKPQAVMEVNNNEMANVFARDYTYLVEYHVVQVTQFQTIADIDIITDIGVVPID